MTAIATASDVATKRSFNEVWVITIGHALTHWYPATFYLLLPLIGNELGLSYAEIGSIVTGMAGAGAISNIPGGILVDSIGRKGLLMAAALFWVGVPYMLMGLSTAYWMLLVCAVLIGIGNNFWHPTAIPTLAQRFPERKGFVLSIHGMGGNVGDAFAPFVAGLLLTVISWRQVMLLNVLPGMIMSGLIVVFLGRLSMDSKAKEKEGRLSFHEVLRGFATLFRNKTLVLLSVSSAFRAMTQSSLIAFLPLYLANVMNYPAKWVGAVMMALQLAGFLAAPIAGSMSDRIGPRNIMVSSMGMTAVVLIAMAFAGQTPAFVFLVAVLGFFLFAVRSILQAWTLDATPKGMAGSAIGMLFGVQSLGSAIGPLTCGLLADRYGLMATFYFMAATIVVANLFVFLIPSKGANRAEIEQNV